MKKLLIISIVLLNSIVSNAQTDTAKVEQYCQIIATPRLLSNKVTIDIDYGEEKSFWRNNRLKTDDGKLKKFNTIIDTWAGKDGYLLMPTRFVRERLRFIILLLKNNS
jgi:hypothetical protein